MSTIHVEGPTRSGDRGANLDFKSAKRRSFRAAIVTLLVALLMTAFATTAAEASTASSDGATVTIIGGPENSTIVIGTGLLSTGIRDDAGITAGAGCTQSDGTSVSCGGWSVLNADLGDGNDSIGTLLPNKLGVVHGGPGNDSIAGDSADNQLYGDAGIDIVNGSGGNDVIDGGPGTDQLFGDSAYLEPGSDGADKINSRDGERDEVQCGMGYDVVTADSLDSIGSECDQVSRNSTDRLSASEARRLLPAILRRKMGSRFKKRKSGTFKRSCKSLTTQKVRCRVRWRASKYRYSGTVTVRVNPADPANSVLYRVSVRRKHV